MTTPKIKRTKRNYRDAPPAPEPPVLDAEFDGPSEAEELLNGASAREINSGRDNCQRTKVRKEKKKAPGDAGA